jgi:hypothetical protein
MRGSELWPRALGGNIPHAIGSTTMPPATTRTLQQELDFFERKRLELLGRAAGKYALIKGAELIGVFDTELEAARAGYRQIGNEPFLIKHIVEADIPLVFTSFNLGM